MFLLIFRKISIRLPGSNLSDYSKSKSQLQSLLSDIFHLWANYDYQRNRSNR